MTLHTFSHVKIGLIWGYHVTNRWLPLIEQVIRINVVCVNVINYIYGV